MWPSRLLVSGYFCVSPKYEYFVIITAYRTSKIEKYWSTE